VKFAITAPRITNVQNFKKRLAMLAACLMLVTTFGVLHSQAQQEPNDPVGELTFQNRQLRLFAAQEMREAAELYFDEIPLKLDNINILSRNDVLALSANVLGVEQLSEENLEAGANIQLIFYGSSRPQPFLPRGFYLVRTTRDKTGPSKSKVELVDKDGNVAATLPARITKEHTIDTVATLPGNTINLEVNTLTFGTQWNGPKKALSVYYSIPLDTTGATTP
jgi:hypothetical protein